MLASTMDIFLHNFKQLCNFKIYKWFPYFFFRIFESFTEKIRVTIQVEKTVWRLIYTLKQCFNYSKTETGHLNFLNIRPKKKKKRNLQSYFIRDGAWIDILVNLSLVWKDLCNEIFIHCKYFFVFLKLIYFYVYDTFNISLRGNKVNK